MTNDPRITLAAGIFGVVFGAMSYAFSTRNRIPKQMPLPDVRKIDPEQLQMGMQIELEHTRNPRVARTIALQHLAEVKDYYSRLVEMERVAKNND
jgi:hypothetical protein